MIGANQEWSGAMRHLLKLCLIGSFAAIEARAACCNLSKVEANPATTRVRVCDPQSASGCAAWVFDGDVAFGASQEVCVSGESLTYQELNSQAGSFGPPTEARCEEGSAVEL